MLRFWPLLLLLLAACASPPKSTLPARSAPGRLPDGVERERLVDSAERYLGSPYVYGGTGAKGFDCSGLVYRVYSESGVRLPRTSAAQYRVGASIAQGELRPGDLVFFGDRGRVNHVGIYTGRGRFIHASTSKRQVRKDKLSQSYFRRHYLGARRVVD